jgi:DNA repair protein RecN (Recombination protein N)
MNRFIKSFLLFIPITFAFYIIVICIWGEVMPGLLKKNLNYFRAGSYGFMLSRLKEVKETKNVDLMIFDEIDTGISGAVSDAVGRKLKELTKTVAQVICITHQPQIASYADNHILVSKEIKENSTFSKLQKLENDSRVEEIARMLAGNVITNEAIANAKAMINLGKVN